MCTTPYAKKHAAMYGSTWPRTHTTLPKATACPNRIRVTLLKAIAARYVRYVCTNAWTLAPVWRLLIELPKIPQHLQPGTNPHKLPQTASVCTIEASRAHPWKEHPAWNRPTRCLSPLPRTSVFGNSTFLGQFDATSCCRDACKPHATATFAPSAW